MLVLVVAAQRAPQRRREPAEAAQRRHHAAEQADAGIGDAAAALDLRQLRGRQHQRTAHHQQPAEHQLELIGIEQRQQLRADRDANRAADDERPEDVEVPAAAHANARR